MNQRQIEKQQFFTTFHTKLAMRYSLAIESICLIRDMALRKGKTLDEIREVVKEDISLKQRGLKQLGIKKINQNKEVFTTAQKTLLNIQARQNLLSFLSQCSHNDWAEITKRTAFDIPAENSKKKGQKWQADA